MISLIFCKFWLSMFTAALAASEIPSSSAAMKESCMEEFCENSQTLAEEVPDQYSVEQLNKDIHEKNVMEQISDNIEQISDSVETNAVNDQFMRSSDAFSEDSSHYHIDSDLSGKSQHEEIYTDKYPERLNSLEGFEENEADEKDVAKPLLRDEEMEGINVLPSSEPNDNHQHEAVFPELYVIGIDTVHEDKSGSDDAVRKENSELQLEQSAPRRRYFPLLYTIRSLFNSFLSEFGDEGGHQETPFNSSDTASGNLTTPLDQIKDLNATTNGTDSSRKTRFQCAVKNITSNATGELKMANSTELLEILNFSKNQKVSPCVLVMFYAPWCHFCARAAPHYNALARAFPQLDVLAVDTSHFSYLNARFGTVAVPNLMLFHSRSAVRFNHTARVLENLIQFVTNNTGLDPDKSVKLEPADFVGPLPSVVVQGRDWLLWLAWTFVIICSTYGFVRSRYGQSFITWMRILWQEHQHIE